MSEHDKDPNAPTIGDTGTVLEEARPKLKKPPMYRVVLLNDDYTPMEFVVQILEQVFSHDRSLATRIMLEVHTKGRAFAGSTPMTWPKPRLHRSARQPKNSNTRCFVRWNRINPSRGKEAYLC